MARPKRFLIPGQVYHLCNRATEKVKLFSNEGEYRVWMKTFREAMQHYPLDVYAYCVMPNHWHLLASCRDGKLISRALKWLGATHAIRWRKMSESTGRGAVYQSRYRCHLVRGNQIFLLVARYIERNPVRAGLCENPMNWTWSSCGQPDLGIRLATWPTPKPENWRVFLDSGGNAAEEFKIRSALLTGRALS